LCVCNAANSFTSSASSAPNASSVAEKKLDPPTLHAKMIALSETLKFLMNFNLVLILFLGFSWLYDRFNRWRYVDV
jgi:hypothetical protein